MRRPTTAMLLFGIGLAMLGLLRQARAAVPTVGDRAPEWASLPGIDDKLHSLSDYRDAPIVVLVFTCNHCPVATAYEERLVTLQKDYQSKGVQVVAVNVNTLEADRLDPMKHRAAAKHFNFPYLFDESQKIGHDYGAKVTPHVFLLDRSRKIAYIGPVDDNLHAEKVKTHYVRQAIDALLAGKTPKEAKVTPVGCAIRYN